MRCLRLQPDDRSPARGARAPAEQHWFLAQVLAASPSGIVSSASTAGSPAEPGRGASARRPGTSRGAGLPPSAAARRGAGGPRPGRVAGHRPTARRASGCRASGSSIGLPAAFFVLEELTDELRQSERAAYEKLIRVMAHEVNNSVGSATSLLPSSRLRARAVAGEPHRLRVGAWRRDCAQRAAEHFHEALRRRLPPSGAGPEQFDLSDLERGVVLSAPGRTPAGSPGGSSWTRLDPVSADPLSSSRPSSTS